MAPAKFNPLFKTFLILKQEPSPALSYFFSKRMQITEGLSVQVRYGPAQSGPTLFGPAQSGPAQSGPVTIGPLNNLAYKQSGL